MEKAIKSESGIINCPNCNLEWDTNQYSNCYCGASVLTSINNFSVTLKTTMSFVPKDDRPKWVPCGDIYGDPVEKVLRFYPEN